MRNLVAITSLCAALCAPAVLGQEAKLQVTPELLPIGQPINYSLEAPAGSFVVFFVSLGAGPSVTPFGTLQVDVPNSAIFTFMLTAPLLLQDCNLPCDEQLIGLEGHFQFIAFTPGGKALLSNPASIQTVDGSCSLDGSGFQSFTQGGWGQGCHGNNVGCLRDANFATVLPNGLLLGDQDGMDGDGHFALRLTSAAAVEAFLPAGSTPAVFTSDQTDATATSAGVFAGQLAAAKLNVAFDAAGLFDDTKTNPAQLLCDLVFAANVAPALIGLSVADVIAIADQVISGELPAPLDIGGEPVSISDLSSALDQVNNNFGDGQGNGGTLSPAGT